MLRLQQCKQSGQLGLGAGALGSPQERGLLYKPELQSVADRVRYIERACSRYACGLSKRSWRACPHTLHVTEHLAAGFWHTNARLETLCSDFGYGLQGYSSSQCNDTTTINASPQSSSANSTAGGWLNSKTRLDTTAMREAA